MARSQRRLRYRRGYDGSGDTAYQFGERSLLTSPQQRAAALAVGFTPPLPTGVVIPDNTVVPTISGTAQVGQTLTGANGTWLGTPTPTFTRQWRRGSADIAAATNTTYVLVLADLGALITYRVTGTNDYGSDVATSLATAAVIAA